MLEFNNETQQDFLNREWVQKLLDVGVDMSDAKYCIVEYHNYDVVFYKKSIFTTNETVTNIVPTYTVSELMNKIQQWLNDNGYPSGDYYVWNILIRNEYTSGISSDYFLTERVSNIIVTEKSYIETIASLFIKLLTL